MQFHASCTSNWQKACDHHDLVLVGSTFRCWFEETKTRKSQLLAGMLTAQKHHDKLARLNSLIYLPTDIKSITCLQSNTQQVLGRLEGTSEDSTEGEEQGNTTPTPEEQNLSNHPRLFPSNKQHMTNERVSSQTFNHIQPLFLFLSSFLIKLGVLKFMGQSNASNRDKFMHSSLFTPHKNLDLTELMVIILTRDKNKLYKN